MGVTARNVVRPEPCIRESRRCACLLRALITKPVAEISEMANKVSMGQLDAPEYMRDTRDEIGSLSASFNRMRRSLQNAMAMLEEQS